MTPPTSKTTPAAISMRPPLPSCPAASRRDETCTCDGGNHHEDLGTANRVNASLRSENALLLSELAILRPHIIWCPVCNGAGENHDEKKGGLATCVECVGVGWWTKHREAFLGLLSLQPGARALRASLPHFFIDSVAASSAGEREEDKHG